jgi:biotin carboxyl carrier protein
MRKYSINVEGAEYVVEIEENAPGEYRVRVGDKTVTVTASETGIEQSKHGPVGSDTKPVYGRSGGTAPRKASSGTGGTVSITSPMPGNVVSVAVSRGTEVKYGDPIIILEAMKMKNEIPSPADGTIREVLVKEGDTVDSEDIIAIIEEVKK